jgi:hypothetical protein
MMPVSDRLPLVEIRIALAVQAYLHDAKYYTLV